VTYIGLAASLKNKQVIDTTDVFFDVALPVVLDGSGNPPVEPRNYTFVGLDVPTLLFRLVFGTPAFRVDLVDTNIQFSETLNSRADEVRPMITFLHQHKGGSFAKVAIVGPLAELDFIPRNNEDPADDAFTTLVFSQPVFANGSQIPNGFYRMLVRALKVTGNPTREADYESFLSPVVGITTT